MKNPNDPGAVQWGQLVASGAGKLGVAVSAAQIAALACHAGELVKWNKKINLTRISDPAEMAIKHYVDSLACVPFLPSGGRILDIGSGGGFPGIPIAVVGQPEDVLMIDSVRKKVNFLQHAVRTMRLDNAQALHVRAQDLHAQPAYCDCFDAVVCRALTGVAQIVEMAFPLLKAGGRVVALKGRAKQAAQECRQLEPDGRVPSGPDGTRVVTYRLPVSNVERSLVVIQKRNETP